MFAGHTLPAGLDPASEGIKNTPTPTFVLIPCKHVGHRGYKVLHNASSFVRRNERFAPVEELVSCLEVSLSAVAHRRRHPSQPVALATKVKRLSRSNMHR